MLESNKALICRWYDQVWNEKRADLMKDFFMPDVVIHGLSNEAGEAITGFEDFAGLHAQFIAKFPDIHFTVEDLIAEKDLVVARCRVTGSQVSDGSEGSDNRRFEIEGISITRIENGKIAEGWNSFDFLSLYKQIGVL